MEHRVRLNLLSTAIVIALGVVVSTITSTVVAARAYQSRAKQQASSQREITVKGSARERVTSDIGVWTITVSGEGKTLPDAFSVLDAGAAKVAAFLKEQGFADAEVTMKAIETTPHHGLDANGKSTWSIEGYELSRQVTVTSGALARMARAGDEVTKLIKDGVAVSSSKPRFYFTKIADLKVKILGEAAKDAMGRAVEIAKNSGGAVGAVRSVQMGVLQITEPNSTEVRGEGIYDTDTIDKDVSAVVTVTYGIDS
jgi:hypothetical protein